MTPVTHAQKQAALDAVLASQAFARTQQLKDFLRYVCHEEMAGRGDALTEYQIGIEALGRRKDFSPLEDTIVRNRAYALRQRLDEYYRGEGQADGLRIDLPRGSYCPRYGQAKKTSPSPPLPPSAPPIEEHGEGHRGEAGHVRPVR